MYVVEIDAMNGEHYREASVDVEAARAAYGRYSSMPEAEYVALVHLTPDGPVILEKTT